MIYVHRLIRSEVMEALRTVHELIKLTMLSYIQVFITNCPVVKGRCLLSNITYTLFSQISLYL